MPTLPILPGLVPACLHVCVLNASRVMLWQVQGVAQRAKGLFWQAAMRPHHGSCVACY